MDPTQPFDLTSTFTAVPGLAIAVLVYYVETRKNERLIQQLFDLTGKSNDVLSKVASTIEGLRHDLGGR